MTKFLFFSGKGGVGKTSLSSATAVMLANRGLKTLLVTTDPASNLGDVFHQSVGLLATPVAGVDNLFIQEIDSVESLRLYKERALAPLRELFPDDVVRSIEEKMSGPCTEEIATFDQFIDCMHRPEYDYVIFDTAPTGHTLRLLELPGSWSAHIEMSAEGTGQTCIGGVEALTASKEQYDQAVQALRDGECTQFVFVTRPDRIAIEEMMRSSQELQRLGMNKQMTIVNGVIPEEDRAHPYAARRWTVQSKYIAQIQSMFTGRIVEMPLYPDDVIGLGKIEEVGRDLDHVLAV
ncbi:ArsA family ATPase [Alicyclobacillus ferrooxydans]|nr:ArsA family ATPase [Alicyclobacillus ferrooxydans]